MTEPDRGYLAQVNIDSMAAPIDEAFERLDIQDRKGPSPETFLFKTPFEHPGNLVGRPLNDMEPERFYA